jgi:hypothetical protein
VATDVTHLWHLHYGNTGRVMRIHREMEVLIPYVFGTTGLNFVLGEEDNGW